VIDQTHGAEWFREGINVSLLHLTLQDGEVSWASKIWPWVLRDFDLRVTALVRPRCNCTVNYRPVLSSERTLQNIKLANVWRKFQGERKIGLGVPDMRLTPRQTDRLTVGRKLTSTSTCCLAEGCHLFIILIFRVSLQVEAVMRKLPAFSLHPNYVFKTFREFHFLWFKKSHHCSSFSEIWATTRYFIF
jgi:hypothetical protein